MGGAEKCPLFLTTEIHFTKYKRGADQVFRLKKFFQLQYCKNSEGKQRYHFLDNF